MEIHENKVRITVLGLILVCICALTYYFHAVLEICTIYTHFFYIPIILTSLWWQRKGFVVALFLAALIILSHKLFCQHVAPISDYLRAFMFIVVAGVVAKLSEHISKGEKQRTQYIQELDERIKELGCLHGLSKLVEDDTPLETIYQKVTELIRNACQHPESSCARIMINSKAFETENFRESTRQEKRDIKNHGKCIGTLEVCCLDVMTEPDKAPFSQEERNLFNVISERLSHIIERVHVEAELRNYREKMFRAEQLASLGTIGSAVAHQLNQPLSVIRLSIQKALRDLKEIDCPDIVKEILNDSLSQVSHASSVVKGFLAFGHTSSDKRVGEIDIFKIAETTAAIFNEAARQAKTKLIVEESVRELPTIRGIAGEIEQIFFIVVQNAVQAAKGDKWRWLRINGSIEEEQVKLKFSDNCGGIEPDILDKIFEPFFTTKPIEQGSGLGLAILQQIVTNHNGSVRVESDYGKGTSFYVTLPIKD